MTDSEFETYLELLGRLLRLSPRQREEISQELRDHFEQRLDELLELGHSRQAAVAIAVEELGDAGGLAANFVSITRQKRQRWAMRFATFSIVGCFVATLLIFSLWPDQNRLPLTGRSTAQETAILTEIPQVETAEARTAKTQNRLEETIIDCHYDTAPFGDVLQDLRDDPGLEFFLDDSSDVKAETPITLNLRSVRLSMALKLLLGQHNSQYIVRDGLVLIASVDKMRELGSEIRVYNCRDLVGNQSELPDLPPAENRLADDKADEPIQIPVESTLKERQLAQLIKSVVAPVSWEEVGQSVVVFDGLMVVNNSAIVHEEIEQLLAKLRDVASESQPATSALRK